MCIWKDMAIHITNFHLNECITYHLPLLLGEIVSSQEPKRRGHVHVRNLSYTKYDSISWPVVHGHFKCLVGLGLYENVIELKYEHITTTFTLYRERPILTRFVRPMYIICSGDKGCFQGPSDEDCSPTIAQNKICLGAMLMQSFTAEKMKEHGFGRKTFQIEMNEEHEPVCHQFVTKLTIAEAHEKSGNELWSYFAKEFMNSDFQAKDRCKWYSFMSFTRYFPPNTESGEAVPKSHGDILKFTKGHTALGGGGLALFGTGNLHTWATHLHEVYRKFTDSRKIDKSQFMDDSAYRGFYWANYATGLGASLHELGHTFDLPHTPTGIMARGFDDIYKVFTLRKKRCHGSSGRERSGSQGRRSRTSSTSSVESSISEEEIDTSTEPNVQIVEKKLSLSLQLSENQTKRHEKQFAFGSPKHNANSSGVFIALPPLVVHKEVDFVPQKSSPALTISVRNYDGTQEHRVVQAEGRGVAAGREDFLQDPASTSAIDENSLKQLSVSAAPSAPVSGASCLEDSPGGPSIEFKDSGAHWYRSSAVTLFFHKWFNEYNTNGCQNKQQQIVFSGQQVSSANGIRVIEMWSEPKGEVFHHYEFLKSTPPTVFTIKWESIHSILPDNFELITVQAMDSLGNSARKSYKKEEI